MPDLTPYVAPSLWYTANAPSSSISFTLWNRDEEIEIEIPARYEVCPHCDGHGKHSAHLGSFTTDEAADLGDEWLDDYRAGNYDRRCELCNGERVILVPDRERAAPELLAAYDAAAADAYLARREREAEIRYGL